LNDLQPLNDLQLEEGPPTREIDSDDNSAPSIRSIRSIPESITSIKSKNPFDKIMKRFKKKEDE
jgi:hypothetical protein